MQENSYFEQNVNSILNKLNISFVWNGAKNIDNPIRFPTGINENNNYTPDFILNRRINNKQILVETHKNELFDKNELLKLKMFKKIHPVYYLVLITNGGNKLHYKLKQMRIRENDICDELWIEPIKATEKQKQKTKRTVQHIQFFSTGEIYNADGRKLDNNTKSPFVTDYKGLYLTSLFKALVKKSRPLR